MVFVVWLNAASQKVLTTTARAPMEGETIPPGSPNQAAPIQQYPYANARNQEWLELRNDDGSYRYHCRQSGFVIDAVGGVIDGTNLQQYPRNDGPNQRWDLDGRSDGTSLVFAHDTTEAWVVRDDTTADGRDICIGDLDEAEGGVTQWWIRQTTDNIPAFRIASQVPPGRGMLPLVLDVPSSTDEDGAVIQQFPDHGGVDSGQTNQAWEIVDLDGTYYQIRSICNGLYLSVRAGVLAAGTPIVQYGNVGGTIRDWAIPSLRNGTPDIPGPIIPRNDPGLRLDVIANSTSPGYYLQVYPDNSRGNPSRQTANQLWQLVTHL